MTTSCVEIDMSFTDARATADQENRSLGGDLPLRTTPVSSWSPDLLISCDAFLQGEYERLFECLGAPAQESCRVGAVDDAMIVGERQRQHQARLKRRAVPPRLHAAARDTENRDLRQVD